VLNLELTETAIDLNEIFATQVSPEHGAQIIFTGIVRKFNQGKKVLAVSYDAHPGLSQKVLQQITEEAKVNWGGDLDIQVIHRFGKLNVGETSLVIAVSSKHREEAFLASRYLIEEIKVRAPIWKKEHYEDGDSEWLQGHALCGHGTHEIVDLR
jgi:molybdopterin synthase catalytic subunit